MQQEMSPRKHHPAAEWTNMSGSMRGLFSIYLSSSRLALSCCPFSGRLGRSAE